MKEFGKKNKIKQNLGKNETELVGNKKELGTINK